MMDKEEHNAREEVFRKTVIELLHPEIASISCSKERKCNAAHEPAPMPELTGLYGNEEKEGKMYGASLPPPGYEQPVNTNMKRTSDLSDGGSNSEADEEQAGARRKRHKQCRRSMKRAANDPTITLEESFAEVKTRKTNLTKNQKRKLKKKRHREKLQQRSTQSKEFTYEQEALVGNEKNKPCVDVVALREFLEGVWDVYSREVTSCCRCGDEKEKHEPAVFAQLADKLVQGDITEEDVNTIGKLQLLVTFNDSNRVSEEIIKLKDSTSLSEGQKQLLTTLFNYWLTNISVLVKQSSVSEFQPP